MKLLNNIEKPTEEKTMEWKHATLKNPCHCICHQDGDEDECPSCKVATLSVLESQDSFRRKVEELEGYVQHDRNCILAQWSAGRNTKDGGYEMKFNGKWYMSKPTDKTPKCNCGLDEVLAKLETLNKQYDYRMVQRNNGSRVHLGSIIYSV